jgi:hypothetical protein
MNLLSKLMGLAESVMEKPAKTEPAQTGREELTMEQIREIYSHMQEMVRFGEAKNGALLTVNFAILYKIMSSDLLWITKTESIFQFSAIGFLIASILIIFISFMPRMNGNSSFNPIYFGSIRTLDREAYRHRLTALNPQELSDFYSELIHINAGIAHSKFLFFRLSIFLSLLSFIASILVYFIR